MPTREPWRELVDSIEQEARALDSVRTAMQERRTLYVALRGRDLEQGLAPLTALAETARQATLRRQQLLEALAPAAGTGARGRANLVATAPRDVRSRLERATALARAAARALRVENALGARLLEFARASQESLVHALAGAAPGADHAAKVYDCNARAVAPRRASGNLVSGNL